MPEPQNTDNGISEASESTDARARQLSGLRPWQPGQSGNPSGRPAIAKRVREALRAYIVDGGGLEKLLSLADGTAPGVRASDQRAALLTVFEFALGKPATILAGPDAEEDHASLEIVISRSPYANTEADPEAAQD